MPQRNPRARRIKKLPLDATPPPVEVKPVSYLQTLHWTGTTQMAFPGEVIMRKLIVVAQAPGSIAFGAGGQTFSVDVEIGLNEFEIENKVPAQTVLTIDGNPQTHCSLWYIMKGGL